MVVDAWNAEIATRLVDAKNTNIAKCAAPHQRNTLSNPFRTTLAKNCSDMGSQTRAAAATRDFHTPRGDHT
eukprot:984213-Lingulodinium_polyedra.AAC.1